MATNNIVLNLLAKDKTKQAFGAVQRGLSNLRGAIFSVQSALIGIGGGLAIRSLIRTGSEVENLGIRFKFLFNSVSEGNKAFDTLIGFAARVPFSLQEIAGASGNLAVVTKNAEELESGLKITGNVAAVTGLDFRQTAEQIQRSFAGGIAAADVFRERGVRALLGFQAGGPVQGAPAQPQPQPQNNLQINERQANPQMYQGSALGTVQEQVMMLQESIEADTVNKARKTLELLKLRGLLENAEPIDYQNPPRSDPRMIPTPNEADQIRNMMIGNFSI